MQTIDSMSNGRTRQWAREYFRALADLPQIFGIIAFRKRTLAEELQEALLRGSLRKAFGPFDLLMLGLGIVTASGWAQLSGYVAQQYAGPAIIVSYVVSGVAALLAACCFAELCVQFPVAGGAFSYIMATFGSLPAFLTLGALLLEFVLGMATTARGFSKYLARLINQPSDLFIITYGDDGAIDYMAPIIVLLMSTLLSLGVRESAWFISSTTAVKIILVLFISIFGYTQGTWDSTHPFIDPNYDADGIFLGAAAIFFTYVGFDAISNTAEEAKSVSHLPWAIVGTPLVAMVMYVMLAFALVVITIPSPEAATALYGPYAGVSYPYLTECEPRLSFITALVQPTQQNIKWMQYVISITALLGIITALTVGLFSVSRIVMAASRDWLLPPFLAKISPRTQTPLVAQMVLGFIIAVLGMFLDFVDATAMVSFGMLVVLWMVSNAQLYRRYYPGIQMRFTRFGTVETSTEDEVHSSRLPCARLLARLSLTIRKRLVWAHMALINAASIALSVYYSVTTLEMTMVAPDLRTSSPAVCTASDPPGMCPMANCTDACSSCCCNPNQLVGNPAIAAEEEGRLGHPGPAYWWFILAWFLATLSFQLCCPLEYEPQGQWHVPWWLMPWLPSAAIALMVFSVGALPNGEYMYLGIFFAVVLVAYLLWALPMSYIKHSRVDFVNTEELNVVELVFKDGQWQPARLAGIDLSQPIPSITSSGMQLHGSVLPRGSLEMARTQDTDSAWLRSSTPLPSVRSSVPKEGKQQALPPAPGRDRGG